MKTFKKIFVLFSLLLIMFLSFTLSVNAERSYIEEEVPATVGNVTDVATWQKAYGDTEVEDTASGVIIRPVLSEGSLTNAQIAYQRVGTEGGYKAIDFKMEFYTNTTDYFIFFSQVGGALNSGKFLGIRVWASSNLGQGSVGRLSVELLGQADAQGTYAYPSLDTQWLGYDGNGNPINYNNDYDYFKDPAAANYDGTSQFTGGVNTLEFKYVGQDLYLVLNGYNLFNLSQTAVEGTNAADGIILPMSENMYVGFNTTSASASVIKVASICNIKKIETEVKRLIGEPHTSETIKDGSVWEPNGNWGAYSQDVYTVVDDNQLDGGDMIFHTAVDGTELVTSEWGYGKHSEIKEKACYDINGLVINFYANTSEFFIYFGENYGTANSGKFFGLGINPQNIIGGRDRVQTRLMAQTSGSYAYPVLAWEWLGYDENSNPVVYNNDYDYFKDPASDHYDGTSSFVGHMNTLEFKDDASGNLSLYLNGFKLYDLTNVGGFNVVGDVISTCEGGMYISFIAAQGAKAALKLTDIYNKLSSAKTGVPQGYTTTTETNISYEKTSAGLYEFKDLGGTDFNFYYEEKKYSGDNKITLQFSADDLATNDTISVLFDDVELEFAKVSNVKANLRVLKGSTVLTTVNDLDFYFTGVDNVISMKLTYQLDLVINSTTITGNLDTAYTALANATGGKVTVGFKVVSDSESSIIITDYQNANVETFESIDDMTVTNNAVIKSYNNGYAVFNNENGTFKLTYNKNKLLVYSLGISYVHGAINDDATEFKVNLVEGTNKIVFDFIKGETKTTLKVFANGDLVAQTEINYDWTIGVKGLSFVDDGGYDYLVYNQAGQELVCISDLDNEDEHAKLKALIDSITNSLVNVEFEVVNGRQFVSFIDYGYYVSSSIKAGYVAGGYETGNDRFGVDKEGEATVVCDGNSTMKSDPLYFDGFEFTFRAFYKDNYTAPNLCLSPSTTWYSLITSKKILMIELHPTSTANTANFRIRYYDGSVQQYSDIADIVVQNFNWNNNLPNTVKLNKVNGSWVFNINGTDLVAENGYSDSIEEIYGDISNNSIYLQFNSGSKMIYRIDKTSTVSYNNAPIAQRYTLENTYTKGDTLTIDLTELFYDADGDQLTYSATKGTISGNTFTLALNETGTVSFSITAKDPENETATKDFTITVVEQGTTPNQTTAKTPTTTKQGGSTTEPTQTGKKKGCKSALGLTLLPLLMVPTLSILALKRKEN